MSFNEVLYHTIRVYWYSHYAILDAINEGRDFCWFPRDEDLTD